MSPPQKGFGLAQYAECMHAVMLALGYQEYSSVFPLYHTYVN